MTNNKITELFQRHPKNPILVARDWPYPVNSVFNPGATMLPDGVTLLLCRVEDRSGHTLIIRARRGVLWQTDKTGVQPAIIVTQKGWIMG